MSFQRYLLQLSYRGSAYKGWQVQPDEITVQSVIQEKLSVLLRADVELTGCGRTDTGVHASQYFAHFDTEENAATNLELKSINALLPTDLAIHHMYLTPETFHARFDAHYRKYIYKLHLQKDPFAAFNSCWLRETSSLNFSLLNDAAHLIDGRSDFRSFAKSGNQLEHFDCTLYENQWFETSPGIFEFHIAANRFVRGMVRLIVGMCINYALQKISKEQILENLSGGQQIAKSYSVPAIGLTLVEVKYPEEKWSALRML
ncbi:MAG: tRNA pseudouridine(38-40) synthase TruA [Saprospiraceae bacterium]|nr:tRNA pseudouridine(38-40) synthase TruA [Saprospiraceae bacterium]